MDVWKLKLNDHVYVVLAFAVFAFVVVSVASCNTYF